MSKHKKTTNSEHLISTVNSLLRPNEEMVFTFRPHRKSYVISQLFTMTPLLLVWLIFDIVLIVACLVSQPITFALIAILILVFSFHLIPIWIWLVGFIKDVAKYKHIEYGLTNNRLILKSGPYFEHIIFIDLQSIYTLSARVGHIEKLFNVGDIYITSDDENTVMLDVKDPDMIMQKIFETASNEGLKILHNLKELNIDLSDKN